MRVLTLAEYMNRPAITDQPDVRAYCANPACTVREVDLHTRHLPLTKRVLICPACRRPLTHRRD